MTRACFLLLFLASTLCLADDRTPPRLRLDDRATPLAYGWRVAIDPGEPRFEGEVRITLRIHRATPVVWRNATRPDHHAAEFPQGERIGARRTPAGREG